MCVHWRCEAEPCMIELWQDALNSWLENWEHHSYGVTHREYNVRLCVQNIKYYYGLDQEK